ncbi:MAG: trehalase family glycosidase [Labilibaculum antarcticum]
MNSKFVLRFALFLIFTFCFFFGYGQLNPQKKFKELFHEVQYNQVFKDQKTFVDCKAKFNPDSILKAYESQKKSPVFNVRNFVGQYFDTLQNDTTAMLRHIHYLWTDLTRKPDKLDNYSSLLPLPNSYIVPGGRFKEIYYWDSYFTMLGLQEEGNVDMIENMVNNFKYLINTYGHIPNGNRSYYLSRSQPPFFSLMVDLLVEIKKESLIYVDYLPVLEKEYKYWMQDGKRIELTKGEILNRYWDCLNTPRPESYRQDFELFQRANRDSLLYKDVRSAAESGWDFSTRWFKDGLSLEQIITTNLLPVDLNCLLYHLEITIAKAYQYKGESKKAKEYLDFAERRKKLILHYFWNEEQGYFVDYNIKTQTQSEQLTLAGIYPLFFNLVDSEKATRVKSKIENQFLKDGGLVTSLTKNSGQQWDYPNGWAPLQWIGYKASKNYKFDKLAEKIATRWINVNCKVFFETGKMMEKYDVVNLDRLGGGGEYESQDGFGWTNGVFLKFWKELSPNSEPIDKQK